MMRSLVPKLRFGEFSGEWEEKRLNQDIEILSGYAFKSNFFSEKGKKLVIPKNFTKNGFANFNENNTKYTIENCDDKYICKTNDLLVLLTDLTPSCELLGKPLLLREEDGEVLLNQRIIKIIPNNKLSKLYLQNLFLTNSFHKKIKNSASGSTVKHSSSKIILNLIVYLPSKSEQQKIANTLSSLDNHIEAQKKKVEALKKHKKGLMQQLFPREGEKEPRLRFEGFSGEWEETNLDNISDIVRGGSPRPIDDFMTLDIDGLNWLKIADVNKNSKYVTKTKEKVKQSALSKTREVYPNDLILSNSMSFGRPYIMKIKACIHDGWIAITNVKKTIYIDYLYYIVLSPSSQNFFMNGAAGGGIRNLNANIIKSLPIILPKDKDEQQKIANCLSSLDNLIEAQNKRIEALNKHKKGLMQQMFVSTKELT